MFSDEILHWNCGKSLLLHFLECLAPFPWCLGLANSERSIQLPYGIHCRLNSLPKAFWYSITNIISSCCWYSWCWWSSCQIHCIEVIALVVLFIPSVQLWMPEDYHEMTMPKKPLPSCIHLHCRASIPSAMSLILAASSRWVGKSSSDVMTTPLPQWVSCSYSFEFQPLIVVCHFPNWCHSMWPVIGPQFQTLEVVVLFYWDPSMSSKFQTSLTWMKGSDLPCIPGLISTFCAFLNVLLHWVLVSAYVFMRRIKCCWSSSSFMYVFLEPLFSLMSYLFMGENRSLLSLSCLQPCLSSSNLIWH